MLAILSSKQWKREITETNTIFTFISLYTRYRIKALTYHRLSFLQWPVTSIVSWCILHLFYYTIPVFRWQTYILMFIKTLISI
jgi:hypothetical protein